MIATTSTLPQVRRDTRSLVPAQKRTIVLDCRPAVTEEEIRIHSWIHQRAAMLHREKYGLWAKAKRLFVGNDSIR